MDNDTAGEGRDAGVVVDERRPAFCYQTHEALDLIRKHFESNRRQTALAIYLVLTETANRLGGERARRGFSAARSEIAESAGVSVRTLDRYVGDFERFGLIAVERTKVGNVNLPNRWKLLDCRVEGSDTADTRGVATPETHKVLELDLDQPQEPPITPPARLIASSWSVHAPPLIEHRAAYLADRKTQRAIRAALGTYPVEDVVGAIENYATCVGGDEYRWSYRWTLVDFLKRGLDKFVPAADPLRNYRLRESANGKQSLAARLRAEGGS